MTDTKEQIKADWTSRLLLPSIFTEVRWTQKM